LEQGRSPASGEGYFRVSAFNSRENAGEAARRIRAISWKKKVAGLFEK